MTNLKKGETSGPSNGSKAPRDWVETAAYFNWEKRGKPHGDAWTDWIEAEREILAWLEASGALPSISASSHTPLKKAVPRKAKFR